MPSFRVSRRRFWPERWAMSLRNRLHFIRLLTLLLALLTLVGVSLAFGITQESVWIGVAAVLGLALLWVHGFNRDGLPLGFLPFELALLFAMHLGIRDNFGPYGVMFLALQHRSLYGSRLSATLVASGYAVVLVLGRMFGPNDVSPTSPVLVLELSVGAFAAYMMHTLSEVLLRDADRKQRLLRSEERYRALFHNNPWPMWLYDPATLRVVEVNASAVAHYGYTRDEFLSMDLYQLRPPEDRAIFDAIAANDGLRERSTHLVRHRKKSGEIIDVEVTGHPVELEGRHLRLAVGVDVSARERAERALRESEARFRLVANSLREALIITDVGDRIILANDRVRDVLGYEPAAIVGRLATELLLPSDQRNAFRDRLRHRLGGESELYEAELVRADGRRIIAEVSASPYRDDAGAIVGTLGAISDITDRKRLEERVRQSSRLEAVGQLAGGVAHDFNNLLTVIKCHAELLRFDLPKDDALRSSVGEIERAADRAAEVTGQLLAFSRRQLMQPRRVKLEQVVAEAVPVLRKLAGERVDIQVAANYTAWVFADPTQLENVLVSLVQNACDAMPNGGRITIASQVRRVEERELDVQNQHMPAGTYAVLSVTDTGTGMTPEVLRRAFEPFFSTKEFAAGSGLGLASTFGTVRQSGGYVDVQSTANGTTFTLYLPVVPVPQGTSPVEAFAAV